MTADQVPVPDSPEQNQTMVMGATPSPRRPAVSHFTTPPPARPAKRFKDAAEQQSEQDEISCLYQDLCELVEEQDEYKQEQKVAMNGHFPADLQKAGRDRKYANLVFFDVFEAVDRSTVPPRKIISTRKEEKWKGEEVRSRFVARDYKWREPDRVDLFAATPTDVGLTLLLAVASALGLSVQTSDLVTAFMHATLHEPCYVEPLVGYKQDGRVWRLKKAINGIRAAPLAFQDLLVEVLAVRMGMVRSLANLMVFKHPTKDVYVDIHVDDPSPRSCGSSTRNWRPTC